MKKNNFIVLALFLFFFGCDKKEITWFNSSLEEALLNSDNKIIMLDFYTDW